ncbi:MAG: RES domain-containing protein, partial [Hyphomicrobiales bacterium]
SLKTEARFFSQTAGKHLQSVFGGIENLKTGNGASPIVDAGPGTALTAFYRARAFQSETKLVEAMGRPDRDLGSAPAHLSGAGRMNAKGISVFYGASTDKVALAEVRPPVGSKTLVGRFEVIRPLRLLDLTALQDIMETGSLFDPGYGRRLERAMFLKYLSERMTEPVMPDDEAFEYLPTQAIADFLATRTEPVIDGILFPSVQGEVGDQNVVLFHKAARVETIDLPKGMKITGKTYQDYAEGPQEEYSVIEWLAPEKKGDPTPGFPDFGGLPSPWIEPDPDGRDPALRVDLKSLVVHHVNSVKYCTDDFDVERSRHQRTSDAF